MSSTYSFPERHIGPRSNDVQSMLGTLGLTSLDELIDATVPASIRMSRPLDPAIIGDGLTESEVLAELSGMADRNLVWKSYLGMGYYGTITPPVVLRNLIEDPRWYTPYTPYQAEVSQGRLEALLNFQTMIMDLTGMEIANASMLDEATAAAEAMGMCAHIKGDDGAFFIAEDCHPQTIAVVQSRAEPMGIRTIVGDVRTVEHAGKLIGALAQYPATDGKIYDYRPFIDKVNAAGGMVVLAADILGLALMKPPGDLGADIAVGSAQRFGVPLGYGGPHAGYLATRDAFKRQIPGRLVGVSKDADGHLAVRLTLQTREQHIRREKATSNICTAQALLANVASMYAVYHGPEGIREIASAVRARAWRFREELAARGFEVGECEIFDTVRISMSASERDAICARAEDQRINLRLLNPTTLTVSFDETTTDHDVNELLSVFVGSETQSELGRPPDFPSWLARDSEYLTHPIFNSIRSETEMLRYLNRLANRDISLANSMIPLGSCTMKLNATAEMIPVTWAGFNAIHPFAPIEQAAGYSELIGRLEQMLAEITGFAAVSLQPNAGSQGEYAGLLVIRRYHADRGEDHRKVCLIPQSAHGTNPASAAMADMKIVIVKTDDNGNVDVGDLKMRAEEFKHDLSALMITYPSTHGVFEEGIRDICDIVHRAGGQVYMDGANMNAQVGTCRPGDFGPDVCHLNLHKTFCIPHGGGGPGMGPIGVASHLARFLPGHPVVQTGGDQAIGPVSAAPWGSPSILPISYAYIRMMGARGLSRATQVAILNANYVARRLETYYPVLYKGAAGLVAHECIMDTRPLKQGTGIEVEDIAKRLMDYGFHAPTVSFPVPGTLMFEPTESESREELDRFCEAMIGIRREIEAIEQGTADRTNNLLKRAPHTASQIASDAWDRPYSREEAAFPAPWTRDQKWWPPVARIDNVFGDRNVVCSCPPLDTYV